MTQAQLSAPTADRMDGLVQRIQDGFKDIAAQYKDYLRTAAKFHRYSTGNVMLILTQRPDATRVAGFNKWRELGRNVRAGEKAIWIFAPCIKRQKKDELEDEGDGEGKDILTGPRPGEISLRPSGIYFRPVAVFDISQTDGEALPDAPVWPVIQGESTRALYAAARQALADMGITYTNVREVHGSERTRGYWIAARRLIWVDESLPVDQQTEVLFHELGHAVMGHSEPLSPETHRGDKENQAQSIAFIVSSHFGFEVASTTFPYLLSWAYDPNDADESLKRLKRNLELVKTAASKIIDAVEPHMKAREEPGELPEIADLLPPAVSEIGRREERPGYTVTDVTPRGYGPAPEPEPTRELVTADPGGQGKLFQKRSRRAEVPPSDGWDIYRTLRDAELYLEEKIMADVAAGRKSKADAALELEVIAVEYRAAVQALIEATRSRASLGNAFAHLHNRPEIGPNEVYVPDICGSQWWGMLHAWAQVIHDEGCPTCGGFAIEAARALHDVVNVKLGKPVKYAANLKTMAAIYQAAASGELAEHPETAEAAQDPLDPDAMQALLEGAFSEVGSTEV